MRVTRNYRNGMVNFRKNNKKLADVSSAERAEQKQREQPCQQAGESSGK